MMNNEVPITAFTARSVIMKNVVSLSDRIVSEFEHVAIWLI